MASVNLTGTLTNPEGEPDEGAIVKFTLLTTTGTTVSSSKSQLEVPQDGLYDIDIVYGNLRVDYINEDGSTRFVAIVTVNGDTVATSLPELLNAAVPPTDAQLLEFQGILADAVTAQVAAEAAETGAVAAEATLLAEKLTTVQLIALSNTFAVGSVIDTLGYTSNGDGGGAQWVKSGISGSTPSQSPAQKGGAVLSDGSGDVWGLVEGLINPKVFGAVGNGVADDTLPIRAWLASGNTDRVGFAGTYIIASVTIAAGCVVSGSKDTVIKRKADSATQLITMSDDSEIHGITIDGNNTAASGSGFSIICSAVKGITISRCALKDAIGAVIDVRDNTDDGALTTTTISNNTIFGNAGNGIQLQNTTHIGIFNNSISSCNRGVYCTATTSQGSKYINVVGNTIKDCTSSGIFFPSNTGSTDPFSAEVIISNNILEGNGGSGIAAQSTNTTVTGNVCRYNGSGSDAGILLNLTDSTIIGNVVSFTSGIGIDAGDCSRLSINSNVVHNNSRFGIEVNSCEDFSVVGNTLHDNHTGAGTPTQYRAGIMVYQGTQFGGISDNGVVSGNNVRSGANQNYGIKLAADTRKVIVSGNSCSGSGLVNDIEYEPTNSQFLSSANLVDTLLPFSVTLTPASSVEIPHAGDFVQISAGVDINTLTTSTGIIAQYREITILFTGIVTLKDGVGNMKLAGDFVAGNTDTIKLLNVNGTWHELSRSTN